MQYRDEKDKVVLLGRIITKSSAKKNLLQKARTTSLLGPYIQ
jgi:hypothetical protein